MIFTLKYLKRSTKRTKKSNKMSGIEETIQIMEEGMKKVTDSLNALNNTCYRDIVKEEQLDTSYELTEEQQDEMRDKETLPRCL